MWQRILSWLASNRWFCPDLSDEIGSYSREVIRVNERIDAVMKKDIARLSQSLCDLRGDLADSNARNEELSLECYNLRASLDLKTTKLVAISLITRAETAKEVSSHIAN